MRSHQQITRVQSQTIETIEGYAELFEGANETLEFMQLSKGQLNLDARIVDLDGLQLEWFTFGARCRIHDAQVDGSLLFGLVTESPEPAWLRGSYVEFGELYSWLPGQENEYVIPSGMSSVAIAIRHDLQSQLDLPTEIPPRMAISDATRRDLLLVCRELTALAQRAHDAVDAALPGILMQIEHHRSRLLQLLESHLQQLQTIHRSLSARSSWALMKRAEWIMNNEADGALLSPGELAVLLQVPRRTLFHAFKQTLGMGPMEFQRTMRLHALRSRLLKADRASENVTQLGLELGFRHLGRMSIECQALFGESPSTTLR